MARPAATLTAADVSARPGSLRAFRVLAPLPPPRRSHLRALAAIPPIAQHAQLTSPRLDHGTCTDDVARLLEVDVLHAAELGWPAVSASAWVALRFLGEALQDRTRRFLNFRDARGRWLELEAGSEDAHGRAVLALGCAIATAPDGRVRAAAADIFDRALPGTRGLTFLHARASAAIGCAWAATADDRPAWVSAARDLAADLAATFEPVAGSSAWPWPEPVVTYESALMPRALIVAGRWLGDEAIVERGLAVLDWLATAATADRRFSPVGNAGWWPRGGPRAAFAQQPIEASSTLLAADAAFDATGARIYADLAERAYGWFLGANDLGAMVADPARGGCRDGLEPGRANLNQGAESTLAWLLSVELIRRLRRRRSPVATGRPAVSGPSRRPSPPARIPPPRRGAGDAPDPGS